MRQAVLELAEALHDHGHLNSEPKIRESAPVRESAPEEAPTQASIPTSARATTANRDEDAGTGAAARAVTNTGLDPRRHPDDRAPAPPETGETLPQLGEAAEPERPACGAAPGSGGGKHAGATDFEQIRKQHTRTSIQGWTQMVLDSVQKDQWVLVVDDLGELTASAGRLVHQLAAKFVFIAAAVQLKKPMEKHFWKFERLEMPNLPPADARRLIRQASAGIEIEDARMFETHLLQKSAGNPRAILESVARLKKEPAVTRRAVRELAHAGARTQIDLTPVVAVVAICLLAFRLVARGLDSMEFYLIAGIGSAAAMGIRLLLSRTRS